MSRYKKGLCCSRHCTHPPTELRPSHTCVCERIVHPLCGHFVEELDKYLCPECFEKRKTTNKISAKEKTNQETNESQNEATDGGTGSSAQQANRDGVVKEGHTTNGNELNDTQAQVESPSMEGAATTDDSPKTTSTQKRKRISIPEPASKKAVKRRKVRIHKGCRVKIQRNHLVRILETNTQRLCISPNSGNSHNYFGTVISGSTEKGWNVRFDVLPRNENIIVCRKQRLSVLEKGEQEKEYDRQEPVLEYKDSDDDDEDKYWTSLTCFKGKGKLSKNQIAELTEVDVFYGNQPDEFFKWEILADNNHISRNHLEVPEEPVVSDAFDFEKRNLEDIFFDELWLSIKGRGRIIDTYHSDRRSSLYVTVQNDKIRFHDPEEADPDWKVRQCYLVMIAAATELENGITNLWKSGKSLGRRSFPDFGKYIHRKYFEAFCAAAPYCMCSRDEWYLDSRDKGWGVFMPWLNSCNEKRKHALKPKTLILDESMSAWRPKTSKYGGLPNYTFEPRKPVPLG